MTHGKDNSGVVKSIGMAEDDHGRTVMRVTVDFYDGAAPDINFKTVFSQAAVTVVELGPNGELKQ